MRELLPLMWKDEGAIVQDPKISSLWVADALKDYISCGSALQKFLFV